MASLSSYLEKIQELTQKNLDILSLLNDSLYTRSEHVTALIDNTTYSIPSFLFLENRIKELESNWKKLINSPKTGEAAFVFDNTTRKIQVQGFNNAPLAPDTHFETYVDDVDKTRYFIESNDVFKDFVTPLIYIKCNLQDLPLHITRVSVRKISTSNSSLYTALSGSDKSWTQVNGILEGYRDDIDYCIYDKTYTLPLRWSDYSGTYSITNTPTYTINSDKKIEWSFALDTLNYTYKDGLATGILKRDDYLITEDDACIFKIISVDGLNIKATVESGYKNLSSSTPLKIYIKDEEERTFKDQKYIKIPLEEDKYIMLFISAVNTSTGVRSTWSTGTLFEVDTLVDSTGGTNFRVDYNNTVRNLGDILNDLTSFSTASISGISVDTFKNLTSYVPAFDKYDVDILNEHLLDNTTVKKLQSLNTQKAEIDAKLSDIRTSIDNISNTLSTTDWSNTDGTTRSDYINRLNNLRVTETQYSRDLNSIITQISKLSTNPNLPLNAIKYTINGNIPYESIQEDIENVAKVIHFELLYRYKNINKDTSRATTLGDTVTISNWNKYIVDYRQKVATVQNDRITYEFESNNPDSTTARWSTFQIPISAGESVDMMYRIQYDLGYPYISLFSAWSNVVNVPFKEELLNTDNTQTIIENNKIAADVNRIQTALESEGIKDHLSDTLPDNNITYYHIPDHIASGFTTSENHIISLKDKLYELNNEVKSLKMSAFGGNYKDISIIVNVEKMNNIISPNDISANIMLPIFDELEEEAVDETKTIIPTITITNSNKEYPIYLYSMFPGSKTTPIDNSTISKFSAGDYTYYKNGSLHPIIKTQNTVLVNSTAIKTIIPQLRNQIIYFRTKSRYGTSTDYEYIYEDSLGTGKNISIIPFVADITSYQPESTVAGDYIRIGPGEAITVPLQLIVKKSDTNSSISCAFDVWNSPFQDPLTYTIKFTVPVTSSRISSVIKANENREYIAVLPTPVAITTPKLNKEPLLKTTFTGIK